MSALNSKTLPVSINPQLVFLGLFVFSMLYCYFHGVITENPISSWKVSTTWSVSLWLPWMVLSYALLHFSESFCNFKTLTTIVVLSLSALVLKVCIELFVDADSDWMFTIYRYLPLEILVACVYTYLYLEKNKAPRKSATNQNQHSQTIEAYSGIDAKTIDVTDVLFINSAQNYVEIHTINQVLIKRSTLIDMLFQLESQGFIQTHRCTLVNKQAIVEIKKTLSGHHHTVLMNGHSLPISRNRKKQVIEALLTL